MVKGSRSRSLPALLFVPFLLSSVGLQRVLQLDLSHSSIDGYLDTPPTTSGERKDFWEQPGSPCFHLDGACRRGNGTWFYALDGGGKRSPRQPSMAYWQNGTMHGFQRLNWAHFAVSSIDKFSVDYGATSCPYDPTPNHVVLQSAHNGMMGEFYSRTVLGLSRWLRDYPPASWNDTQMHIHFVVKMKQELMHGHRLFLGGLPNNNKFDNWHSAVESEACKCFKKLVFCGYRVHDALTSSEIAKRHLGIDSDHNVTIFSPHTLVKNPKTSCAFEMGPKELLNNDCDAYQTLREGLMNTYSRKDLMLSRKILLTRTRILSQEGAIGKVGMNTTETDGWKIVGLAHRKFRRRWIDINDTIAMCNDRLRECKVVCIPIDVEEASSAEEQLLMHASLDAFVGVHGAQLTQGVLLPGHTDGRGSRAAILELLPWIPPYLMGDWVATTDRPTPLGVIFHNTDLTHVGYALGRDSVPLCLHVDASDESLERECLTNKTNSMSTKFRWDNRDFTVEPRVVEDFIVSFVLHEDDSTCGDMQRRAAESKFVLYNAFCWTSKDSHGYHVEHYYKSKS